MKADLERELGRLVLDCSTCGQTVHWVAGLGAVNSDERLIPKRCEFGLCRSVELAELASHDSRVPTAQIPWRVEHTPTRRAS